jgi:hypothetical protein
VRNPANYYEISFCGGRPARLSAATTLASSGVTTRGMQQLRNASAAGGRGIARDMTSSVRRRLHHFASAVCGRAPSTAAAGPELSAQDFVFDGSDGLGSAGTTIERIGRNHFRVNLGSAPSHPEWCNKLQFTIPRGAKGVELRLDVLHESPAMSLNEYFASMSYNGKDWIAVPWAQGNLRRDGWSKTHDTLLFPIFEQDRVVVGHQIPMTYEDSVALVGGYCSSHPTLASTVSLGRSVGGRTIQRLEISDRHSAVPRSRRWVFHISNQHPGEHNAQWRMTGMASWLLSDDPLAQDFRQRSIFHFIFFSSPDAPSNGWYRVCSEGVDMNRSYYVDGAAKGQAHEANLVQADLERMMRSDEPVTLCYSMHTWTGIVEQLLCPGPELHDGSPEMLGDGWQELREIMRRNERASGLVDVGGLAAQDGKGGNLMKPLALMEAKNGVQWTDGPHLQFGISAVLCEGGSHAKTKELNVGAGAVIVKSLAEYYVGCR